MAYGTLSCLGFPGIHISGLCGQAHAQSHQKRQDRKAWVVQSHGCFQMFQDKANPLGWPLARN